MFTTKQCQEIIKEYPRSQILNENNKIKKYVFFRYRYGTSGFRGDHQTLDSIMIRVGLLAVLRSFATKCQAIGIMVTASHNQEQDNGVKIIDPSGEMMHSSWEQLATQIANKSEDEILSFIQSKYDELECKNDNNSIPTVFIGRDTRPHSKRFAELVTKGASSINSKVIIKDFGEVTTPHLHYLVMRANNDIGINAISSDIYLNDVIKSYKKLIALLCKLKNVNPSKLKNKVFGSVIVDCANGVGGIPFKHLQSELSDLINIDLIHLPFSPKFKVNDGCGAEYVHKSQSLPIGLVANKEKFKNVRIASLDGDCDRLMYAYLDNSLCLNVCDGDKQICLLFEFMRSFIDKCGCKLSVGVVQTGYANGASTEYIFEQMNVRSIITPTGVKYLHHEAKKYDISIYFEANGHGTVLISDNAVNALQNALKNDKEIDKERENAINVLLFIHSVSNQAIGDAMADFLMVEAALFWLDWSVNEWNGIYKERPSKLTKLRVTDRTLFKTTNAEQTCVEPKGIQQEIDKICGKYKGSRSFVRPSGTEDVVRIYSEAQTQSDADNINLMVQRAVYDIAGGVGKRP